MIKSRKIYKTTIFLIALFTLMTSIFLTEEVRAVDTFDCVKITTSPGLDSVELKQSGTTFSPASISVHVEMRGQTDQSIPASTGYIFRIAKETRFGDDWDEVAIPLELIRGSLYAADFTVNVNDTGKWKFHIATSEGKVYGDVESVGCLMPGQDDIIFNVGVKISDTGIIPKGCRDLKNSGVDVSNRYTCQSSSVLGLEFSQSGYSLKTDIVGNCSNGYKLDVNACSSGRTQYGLRFNKDDLGVDEICIPCVSDELNVEIQSAHEECSPPDVLASLDPSVPRLFCDNSDEFLDCRPNAESSTGYMCIFAEDRLGSGETCYLNGNECNKITFCERPPGSNLPENLGVCTDYKDTNYNCGIQGRGNSYCETIYGEGAACVKEGFLVTDDVEYCVAPCSEKNPNRNRNGCDPTSQSTGTIIDTEDPVPGSGLNTNTPTYDSSDYGVRNCPGAPGSGSENNEEYQSCSLCVSLGGTWTALGCIGSSPNAVFGALVRIAIGVLGGVALLRLIYLGYLYQTRDEAKIAEAKQGVISTLGAIVLVLFSILLLQVIGVNILDVVPTGFFG